MVLISLIYTVNENNQIKILNEYYCFYSIYKCFKICKETSLHISGIDWEI